MLTTRLLLTVVLIVHLASLPVVSARATTKVTEQRNSSSNNSTDWTSWLFSYALRPPSKKQVEEGLEARWKQLEEEVSLQKSKFSQHVEEMSRNAQETRREIDKNVELEKKKLKKRIETQVFKQRQGWKRFRNSVRAQAGIVMGGAMTFAGGALSKTSPRVQAAQLTWNALDNYNITRGIHDPWMKDAAAGVITMSLVVRASKGQAIESVILQRAVPLATIGFSIAKSVSIILDNFDGDVTLVVRAASEVAAAVIGTTALAILPIPLCVVATSVAGANLLYQSVIAEVVGNWFYFLECGARRFEGMDREKRRKIERNVRNQVYHQLEKKLMYPVRTAYDEIHAALSNETLASPSLHDKVHTAIQHSMQVKLVWSCAAAGIVLQLTWKTKPVESALSAVRSWWSGLTNPQPRAIKKRKRG